MSDLSPKKVVVGCSLILLIILFYFSSIVMLFMSGLDPQHDSYLETPSIYSAAAGLITSLLTLIYLRDL